MTQSLRGTDVLALVAPFLLWGAAFVTLYAGHGLACGVGVRPDQYATLTRLLLAGAFFLFVAAHLWLLASYWRKWREAAGQEKRRIRLASLTLSIGAVATTVWTGSPVLFLSICS